MEKLESGNSSRFNDRDSVQLRQLCGEMPDNAILMINPAASLPSINSSGSCCSDFSVDANSDVRVYVDECSTDSSQEDSSSAIGREAEQTRTGNSEEPKDSRNERYDDDEAGTSCNDEFDAQFWLPPQPEDDDDDIEDSVANYDDDECVDGQKWGSTASLISFGEEDFGSYKLKEERQKALQEVMNMKLKAFVSDHLKSFGVAASVKEGDNWVDIITSLSWEAASFVKPDSREGKMNPVEYVKIKCISTGSRSQSRFVRGLVFKKHAAHKHMPTQYDKPRLLLIEGALGLSRKSELSSFEESVQQEKDSVKSILDMIERYQPNVVLVENAVSRDIQESILKKGVTLVFDMKQHRLEKVARCTGSLSADILVSRKLRQCDSFHFEKFAEEHSASGDAGKKPSKTLMFIEGCPTRLGCTILLMGSNSDELKKIKHVVKDAIIVAYNLILETSFLLDQKAMFSTLPLSQEVNLTLGNETPSVSDGQGIISNAEEHVGEISSSGTVDIPISNGFHEEISQKLDAESESLQYEPYNPVVLSGLSSISSSVRRIMGNKFPLFSTSHQSMSSYFSLNGTTKDDQVQADDQVSNVPDLIHSDAEQKTSFDGVKSPEKEQHHTPLVSQVESLELEGSGEKLEDQEHMKDNVASLLDSESILVLMSCRNASKGTMCKHSHFSRIKFYQDFDIPLEKFLQDNLLNQKECKTCGESPEAHIFHYVHHNKLLTIQVQCLPMDKGLRGEHEGKLWMWSRCCKCKSQNGSSFSTKRVLISTGSRGFSFGKFLELSFSNSPFFSGLSACGHSFDKDFLYFFGLGRMVAMFKYSTVTTYSVFLPPKKLEFSSSIKGEFLKQEFNDVYLKGIMMFIDVEKALKAVESHVGTVLNLQGSIMKFSEIENMLKEERSQFEVDVQNVIEDGIQDVMVYKLLSLNRIRLDLLLESCVWDRRLHSLLSSYYMDGDSKAINPKQSTLPDIEPISQKELLGKNSGEGDANGAEANLRVGDEALEDCHDLNIEFAADSSAEENNGTEAIKEYLNHNCDVKLNLVSTEANGSLIVEASVGGFREQNGSLNSSAFTEVTELSTAAKTTGNGSSIEDPAGKFECLHCGDENNLQSNLPSPTHLQLEKPSLSSTNGRSASDSMDPQRSKSLASILSNIENDKGWWAPFPEIRHEYMKDLQRGYLPKLGSITTHAVETTAYKLVIDEGARLHIPLGNDKYIVSDYEDEFSSIIACALASLKDLPIVGEDLRDDGRKDRGIDDKAHESSQGIMRLFSLAPHFSSSSSLDLEGIQSTQVSEQTRSSSMNGLDMLNSLVSFSTLHPEVSMGSGKLPGKRKYSVICLYGSEFSHLRGRCCPSEVDYIASLSRCRKWDAKGGKSKSLFAKTLDDRFIIKEIQRIEFESFLKFGPNYFEYMEQCYKKGNQTCLAKVLGIYQVIVRPTKSGKETRHDLMVMENLSFGRNITRQYDLKGALHARFNSAGSTDGDVLLDQNFVNDMKIAPLYVGTRSKRNLQRAVWNDCGFLNSVNVMDYSLLVGVDTQHRELVCGIIDYLRQYTWDKQIENWVKSSLVVPKNQLPTVLSPREYKKRFRKFIDTHFLSVPENWCSQRPSNPCILCSTAGTNAPPESKSEDANSKGQEEHRHESSGTQSTAHGNQNDISS
ncbi:putative 1-phosphatidylinositol-3-phosphate 5-kinase FAB1D isoform X1 [Solanum tuberosum]|uniref:putative 1-phosphatidylinositol-3-phosphate 5-kinase FAB1D isoform X1 n=1 Tax=Solanum tuberosum TaxID=4113 RepID=UPI0003D28A14|nr:PREDICTED: putative 1-phosphatidylinositol-3-phosphate 5-kinase FAB1D isoform X1 [Solanum tuberosum]XP_015165866.1 PREDICTED: putative 1-phosphatidylinositol-3-phosphate 5-kinase FAB1D isoform X1 [Solanum tuberosum]XP_015165867.1 PREDICTED: putative 1-phosphatidylinositol-3-phosphate 5-kinase FAB1D isoform X1 [Solanum tuberosum]XP_015165868.1 PREDICTED: putative 1-phosphatidylinositol-3-phosphate 5-kinase FAB1D isoform X1 [Solanum tuberosum]